MLTGKPPFYFSGMDQGEGAMLDMMHRIKAGDFSIETSEWQYVSDDAKSLIKGDCFSFFFSSFFILQHLC
jgi:hypothetical protein